MKNRRLVSVDLGSSYTKVAVRRDWDDDSQLLRDLPLATPEVDFCVPSVVARVEAGGGERWLVGAEAAAQHPGEGVHVHRYFKAQLFSPGGDVAEAERVAEHFFRGLRAMLSRLSLGLDLETASVRVCVPRLESGDGAEPRIAAILERAGLRPARGRATVFEPESNACGVLTRARNATWFPPRVSFLPSPGRSLHLREMLEPEGLLEAFRRLSGSFGVLVVDIGGFTTDFGYVEFDTSFATADWHRPKIVQQSYELGIRELDQAVLDGLSPEAREAVERLSSSEWDAAKARLYRGEPVTLAAAEGREVVLGAGEEAERSLAAIREFAARVIGARERFLQAHVRGPIDAQTLTGGGAMIAPIRRAVAQALGADARARVYDLLDEEEPRRTLELRAGGAVDAAVVEERARRNLELVRGASAIGGSSVFFE